ncbi:MAG: CRISPR-associated endoribonuclease Cas6 [Eubacteriaceae bacterium]|nr:CRISPR-associated endoribonuclease Cas6 [Eubacteriaceae bacterium]
MKVYELKVKVFLLKDIPYNKVLEKNAAFIDVTLGKDPRWAKMHETNGVKGYSLGGLMPIERKGIYHEGRIYEFSVRTVRPDLAEYLHIQLADTKSNEIKGLTAEKKIISKKMIQRIYSLTPVILKTDRGYWRSYESVDFFEQQIKNNLIKKYNTLFHTKLDENFTLYTQIKFDNEKPVATPYKNVKLLGDKVTMMISNNETAQELAYLSLGCSLGNMGSRGFGFMGYVYYK